MRALLAAILTLGAAEGSAQEVPPVGPSAPVTGETLMRMDAAALDALFAGLKPGPLPHGEAAGIANSEPGSGYGAFTRGFFRGLWEGKTFDRERGTLTNRTAFGKTGSAKVYYGTSRVDGKPCIIFDYAKSDNLLARGVLDEVREVSPGLYLGIAYLKFPPGIGRFEKWIYFSLDFRPANPAP